MKHFAILFTALVLVVVSAVASAQVVVCDGTGGTSYKVSSCPPARPVMAVSMAVTPVPVAVASYGDSTGVAGLRREIVKSRPGSSGNPEIDRDNNRTDLEWGRLAQQRERDAQRVAIEQARLQRDAIRDAQRYEIERQRQAQRSAESWSRMIGDWRKQSARQQEDQRRANDRERERVSRSLKDLGRASADLGKAWAKARPKPTTHIRPR